VANNINKKPTTFRGPLSTGLAEDSKIETDGGEYSAGLISGFAVITRGEALGHGMWIDEVFVGQVSEALSKGSVKSRYTHPGMSSDGLGKGLGRVHFRTSEEKDVVRGDLHFYKSSRRAPDGDLGGHVLSLAEEAPEDFGASIVFYHEANEETKFLIDNGAELKRSADGYQYLCLDDFKSPDPLNTQNLPHCRLESLKGCDIVGDPAANPDGLFSRDSTFEEIQAFAEYIFGESEDLPTVESFDVDPERAKSFLSKFLSSKGLVVMSKSEEDPKETPPVEPTPTEPTEPTPAPETEPAPEAPANEPKADSDGELSAGQKEAARFKEAFGEGGADYFADGLTFKQATDKHIAKLNSKIEAQGKEIKSLKSASETPVDLGDPSDKTGEKKRKGFASKIEAVNAASDAE